MTDGRNLKLLFEVLNSRRKDESNHINKIVESKSNNGSIVILTFLILSDVGDDVGKAEIGQIGEHEVDPKDYTLLHHFFMRIHLLYWAL